MHFSRVLATLLAATLSCAAASRLAAVERCHDFLHALRSHGHFDDALQYIERMKTSPLATDDFKEMIPYEQGVTLVEQVRTMPDGAQRDETLNEALQVLQQFVETQPESHLAAQVRDQLARLLLERGRGLLRQSTQPAEEDRQSAQREGARSTWDKCLALLEQSEAFYVKELKSFPKVLDPKTEATRIEQRNRYRSALLNSRLLIATTIHEQGKSYPSGEKQFTKLVTDAAKRFHDLHEKYRTYLAGLKARLWEGRCYHDLGQLAKANGCYENVIGQPAQDPDFRALIAQAYHFQAECLIDQKKYDQAIKKTADWLKVARGTEDRRPEWLAVKYQAAVAHEAAADQAADDKTARRRHLKQARELVKDVKNIPGPFQDAAQKLFARLPSTRTTPPASFKEAFDEANDAVQAMRANQLRVKVAAESDPQSVPELKQQLEENRDAALTFYRVALRLANDETPVDQLNMTRYYLSYLHWEIGRYFDAIVFGEFLARKFPDSPAAKEGAKIAMAAYQKLAQDPDHAGNGGAPQQDFASRRIADLAVWVAEKWRNEPIADQAHTELVRAAVQAERWDEALAVLDNLSPTQRGPAEVHIGLALWNGYVRAVRSDAAQRPDAKTLTDLRTKAQSVLESSLKRPNLSDTPSPAAAAAALSLAQIYLDATQYDKAIERLEDPRIGPLTLLDSGHAAAARSGFAEQAYQTALRAYVSVRPAQPQDAERMVLALEKQLGDSDTADGAEKLTKIYLRLGQQLQNQLTELSNANNQEELQRIAVAFEAFLDRVADSPAGNNWNSRLWVAQTYSNLADALAQGAPAAGQGAPAAGKGAPAAGQAKGFYDKASQTYQAMLSEARTNKSLAPSSNALLAVKIETASSLRNAHRYKEALDLYAQILGEKPTMLDAQIAAAATYQQRGRGEDPKWYVYAWSGGRKDPQTKKNRIWGWSRLAQVAVKYPKYRAVFFQARYNLARCRFEYAASQQGANKKKYLTLAKNDVRYMAKLYPDLGGVQWKPAYQKLLEEIQQRAGDKPIGLAEFQPPKK